MHEFEKVPVKEESKVGKVPVKQKSKSEKVPVIKKSENEEAIPSYLVGHSSPSKEQISLNFMAAVTIPSDFGAPQK